MISKVTFHDFINAFNTSDTYKNKFTRDGLIALFDYLEDYEEETGEEMDFDMVAICCDFSEYKTAWEAMEQYKPEDMPVIDMEENSGIDLAELQALQEEKATEWLGENTTVIKFDTGIIIRDF